MPRIEWDEKLSVGNRRIDRQHMFLIQTYNQLYDAFELGEAGISLRERLRQMSYYCRKHFADEEALMSEIDYDDLDRHRAEHQSITAQVRSLQERHAANESIEPFEVLNLLGQWLTNHIDTFDRRLAENIRKNSPRPEFKPVL